MDPRVLNKEFRVTAQLIPNTYRFTCALAPELKFQTVCFYLFQLILSLPFSWRRISDLEFECPSPSKWPAILETIDSFYPPRDYHCTE